MTTLLERTAPTLAINAVVGPLTVYGLHRLFPAPNVGFLAIASAVTLCTSATLSALGGECVKRLMERYERKDRLFSSIHGLSTVSLGVLLTIFARYVGQKIGIQVPEYLQTVGYFTLVSNASWAVRTIYEILSKAHESYHDKPAIK